MNMVVPDKKPMYSIPMRARATDNPIVSLKQMYTVHAHEDVVNKHNDFELSYCKSFVSYSLSV